MGQAKLFTEKPKQAGTKNLKSVKTVTKPSAKKKKQVIQLRDKSNTSLLSVGQSIDNTLDNSMLTSYSMSKTS